MIKFFRKIRQDLLSTGKTGKYLKYAIGEISLVIIGILIAVSINSWNEENKNKREEQSVLIDLKDEMITNLRALEVAIDGNEKSLQAAKEMIALFWGDRKVFEDMPVSVFEKMCEDMNMNLTYDPSNGILNSIISSGQINKLSNKELKYLLASIKEKTIDALEDTKKIEAQRDEYINKSVHDAAVYEDGKIVSYNSKSFFDNASFRTVTHVHFKSIREQGLQEENELKKTLEHIIELINQEIKK